VTLARGFQDGDEIHFDELGIAVKVADISDLHQTALKIGDGVFTTVQVGSNNDTSVPHNSAAVTENRITFNVGNATSKGLGISTIDLDSLGEAQSAINYLDSAIAKVNDERSNIGSLQNRFEFTSSNLLNSIQNNSASMSTIRDADFAVEAADLARNQILTQSGTAMLAQANSLSQNVLSLIR
jgi:flagellin